MGDKSDSRSRKWMITINNPLDKGFTHDKIKEVLTSIRSLDYWAMCDEIGNEKHTLHTHIIIHRGGALRFSTLQKMFPPGSQLDNLRGTIQQARDYIRKEGKYKGSNKEETNLKNTFEESGIVPDERQGQRSDLIALYDMIKDGKSNYEILEDNPNYMLQLERWNDAGRFSGMKNLRMPFVKCMWNIGSGIPDPVRPLEYMPYMADMIKCTVLLTVGTHGMDIRGKMLFSLMISGHMILTSLYC